MADIVILALLGLLGGGFALRLGRVFLQRSADRASAEAAAASAAAGATAADQAMADARHRAHPDWLVTLWSTVLRTRVHPLEQRRSQLTAERDEAKAALDDQPAGPSLVRKLLGYAALLMLPLLFLLSMYQLIPSFFTLSGSVPLAFVGGVLVAAIEVGVAFALARVLYHAHRDATAPSETNTAAPAGQSLAGRLLVLADSGSAWSKSALASAITLLAAGLLIWGQYSWAKAHDVIPLQGQLTVAEQTYAQDQQNHVQASLLTSDQMNIGTVTTRLAEVRERDEALALLVPLGEDAAALPALGALGFAAEDLRRRGRRRRIVGLNQQIRALDVEIEQARNAITLELQQRLERLGIDPAIVPQAPPRAVGSEPKLALGSAPAQRRPVTPSTPPGPTTPAAAEAGQPSPPLVAPGTREPVTIDDLFPDRAEPGPPSEPTPLEETETGEDRRWSDPL